MAKKPAKEEPSKQLIKTTFAKERVLTENSDEARELYNQSRYGSLLEDGKIQLSLLESLYLLEKKKIEIIDGRKKKLKFDDFLKKAQKLEPNFWVRYTVFKNIRDRGYIINSIKIRSRLQSL